MVGTAHPTAPIMSGQGIQARRVLYSGFVQGVGFRFTAVRIAQGLAVTGFVRNLPDGRVELVAEGAPAELDRLHERISTAMSGNIESVEIESVPPTGRYASFEIR